jgi:formate dehydrogenase iron-sulfur subunit
MSALLGVTAIAGIAHYLTKGPKEEPEESPDEAERQAAREEDRP